MRWRVLPLVVGLVVVSGCAGHGDEVSGASEVTRPTKAPVRPTVEPAEEYGDRARRGASVE